MSLGLFNCRLIQPAGDQLFFFVGCLAAPLPVRASSVQSPCDPSCSAPTSGRAQNASCLSFSESFCFGFRRGRSPVGCRRVHVHSHRFTREFPRRSPIPPTDSAIEPYFDAVGTERRLTPFGPIRIRTVICKGDGLLDCIGFNGSGQFSYFVRDDREYQFPAPFCIELYRSRMTSTTRRPPRASSTTVAALPGHHLSEWPRLKIEIALALQPQGATNRFEF